ncbi:hypothetical protein [Flavobacterium quisquiliarum]|jgi:hypothetical protein|uniref:DUF4968 domain-containing protein n=1 Tax=Flavobacterium quisquiliarum TaxID=1834436 RepID=A0ABV8WE94_9FLAO|nr:hypothetical protein [Flavobacterium quisquiliarum]MBW1655697.1 hypothetical protein [Flavobacterium quisquiliarum]NWK99992.1 hypothetical protein [Flavobacterium collinsii]
MKKSKSIFLFFLLFIFSAIYAHKDRIEVPQRLVFVMKNKEVVRFDYTDVQLEKFCKDIVYKRIVISEVQLFYKTGEIVTVQSDGINLTLFKITFKGKSLYVPSDKLKKINEINFFTLYLFWSGESNAFNSHYLCLRFDIGIESAFNVFPNLELHFEDKKFTRAEVWTQTSKNSRQGKIF